MNMQNLEISALDTLFFKDGKPFSMGEESWAKGVFPPYPSTMYGMLRSIWFADHIDQLIHANQHGSDQTLQLQLTAFLPMLDGDVAFPIPADLYGGGTEARATHMVLKVLKDYPNDIIGDYPLTHKLKANVNGKFEELSGKALLRIDDFKAYLHAQGADYAYENISDYTCEEPKVGIGRDRQTHTSAPGQLYRLSMKRLAGKKGRLSFLLGFTGLRLPPNGLTRIGAEIKTASYAERQAPQIALPPTNTRFKIYLATPAIFEQGAYPKAWFQQQGIELLAAVMGKAEHIGGFDIKTGRPKPMYKAVPAGTVYYVQVADLKQASSLQQSLHQGSIYKLAPDTDEFAQNHLRQGFGLSFIGNVHSTKD